VMERADQRRLDVEARAQCIDLVIGTGLCAVAVTRVMLGSQVQGVSWNAAALATMALAALAIRQQSPRVALALATTCGILAMSIDLRNSAVDLLLGLALVVVTLRRLAPGSPDGRMRLVFEKVAGDLRGRWSLAVLAFAAVAGIVVVPVDFKEAAGIAILLAAYAVGGATDRTTTLVSGLVSAGILAIGAWLVAADAWTGPDTPVPLIAAALVGAAVGDASRSRRALAIATEEHARRIEQAHEEESRRRVIEERMRIARDVHDLVAHHIAVVNVHAGVAGHLVREQPADAMEALGHVRIASRTALDELGTLLGVLRESGEMAAPTEPTPRLADLGRLLDSIGAVGPQVAFTELGCPRPLPLSVDLAAYRIVQEALTNAHKHGRGRVRLTLTYTPGGLAIEMRNELRNSGSSQEDLPGAGHGLVGMHERVASVGGRLEAGPTPGGEFVVRASLHAPFEGRREDG
jgi:signal transduction histidine kinase